MFGKDAPCEPDHKLVGDLVDTDPVDKSWVALASSDYCTAVIGSRDIVEGSRSRQIVIGPIVMREGGYAFDAWSAKRGLQRVYTYRRIQDATYSRMPKIAVQSSRCRLAVFVI